MKEYSDINDYELMYLVSENNDEYSDIIYKKYYPLIEKLAKKYKKVFNKKGLELDDFIQEGYVGLFNAIKNYSEVKNCLFFTYAKISIISKMRNLIHTHSASKCSPLNECVSLNTYFNSEEEVELIDVLEDDSEKLPEIEFDKTSFYEEIKQILYSLSLNYSAVFELKLNGFNNSEISKLLDISKSNIYHILDYVRNKYYSLKNYF